MPSENLGIIIVIPCFHEPDILTSLGSLLSCPLPSCDMEVIIVLNYPEDSSAEIIKFHNLSLQNIQEWIQQHTLPRLRFFIINAPALSKKFAGVGWARKIGMDEAAYRFSIIGREKGIIVGFDADARVDPNYMTAIESHFLLHPKTPGASLYFEHPLNEISDPHFLSGILQYELHLRYLVQAIRFTNFPNAFHTVGSSFAVRADAYVKQGGMNRFKAGEDFYFLNKIIQLGAFTELNDTRVIPAPRVSSRVPFGTGASMSKWMESEDQDFLTYSFDSFLPLKNLFSKVERIYQMKSLPSDMKVEPALMQFLNDLKYLDNLEEIFKNSSSLASFTKRFFQWFDAFQIVKYLNFSAFHFYPKKPVKAEAVQLLKAISMNPDFSNSDEILAFYRRWDRGER